MGCAASAQSKVVAIHQDQQPKLDPNTLSGQYEIGHVIGKGAFATCRSCRSRANGEEVCVKTIKKSSMNFDIDLVWGEINAMKAVKHPGCIQLKGSINTNDAIHIVQEIALGGDLWDRIQASGAIKESTAIKLSQQLVSALEHLHKQGIAHRDIKPENVVMMGKRGTEEYDLVKLVDFGFATWKMKGYHNSMATIHGTPEFAAPELLKMMLPARASGFDRPESYSAKIDIWAMGGIVYTMLNGGAPFKFNDQVNMPVLCARIFRGELDFEGDAWKNVSMAAKQFVRDLMSVDAHRRPTAQQCLAKGWLKGQVDGSLVHNATTSAPTRTPSQAGWVPSESSAPVVERANNKVPPPHSPVDSATSASTTPRRVPPKLAGDHATTHGAHSTASSTASGMLHSAQPHSWAKGQAHAPKASDISASSSARVSRAPSVDSQKSQRTTVVGGGVAGVGASPSASMYSSATTPQAMGSGSNVQSVLGLEALEVETQKLLASVISSSGSKPLRQKH